MTSFRKDFKDYFIDTHEELIEAYLEKHPKATDNEAYEKTADLAHDRTTDRLCNLADRLRSEAKDK